MNIETVRQIVRQESPSRIFGGTVVSADPRGTRTATVRDNGGHVHSRVRTCTEDLGVGDQVVVARLAGMDRLVVLGKIASPHGSSLSTMGVLAPPSNFSVLAFPAMVYAQWDTYPGECLSWEVQYSLNGSPYADAAQVLVSRGSYYLYPCNPGTTVYMRARAVRWIGDNNLMRSAWTSWASASAADYEVPNLIIDLTNKSGGARIATEVVVVDTTTDESFTTTVAVGDLGVIGVVMESIANNAIGQVCISGLCQILIDNAVTRGHYLQASATAGRADGSAARAEGSFARALESGVQDDTIWAVISLTLSGNAIVSASLVEVEEIGTATYDDVQDWINNTQSAGRITGGAVTAHAYPITGVTAGGAGAGEFEIAGDHTAAFVAGVILTVSGSTGNDGDYTVSAGGATHAGGTTTIPVDEAVPNGVADGNIAAGTVDAASGTGFIKDADSDTATAYSFDWAATTTPLIPTNDTSNWVYLDYNGGSPVVGITDDHDIITRNDTFVLDRLWREDSTLYIVGKGQNVYNLSMRTHRNLTRVFHFQRGNGVKLTEKGTRKVGVSAGNLYRGLNEIPVAEIDTSAAGTFTTLYRDGGGGWTQVTGQTTIDNTNYDDGSGVLQGITNNQYGAYWVYLDYAGNLYVQYGQGSYHLAEAEAAQFPVTRTYLDKFAMLIAKIVVMEGALENFYSVEYPWDVRFVAAPVANHNNLGGLQGGVAGEYYHLTLAQHTVLTGAGGLLPAVAGAGYALVSDGVDSWVADQSPDWTGKHSFGAGIAFTGASGANEITIPDDVAIALELLDAGGLEYMRTISTNAQPVTVFNFGEVDINFRVAALGITDALFVQGSTGFVAVGRNAPEGHFDVYDVAVDTTISYYGIHNEHVKTLGATDRLDDLEGIYNHVEFDQVGGTIGYFNGLNNRTILTSGSVGDGGVRDMRGIYNYLWMEDATCTVTDDVHGILTFIDLNGGTVGDDIYGHHIYVNLRAALTSIGGDVYGFYLYLHAGQDPVGTAYSVYWEEGTNVDYGIYQNGTAPNRFGGDVDPANASGQDLGDATHRWDLYTQDVIFGGATGANVITVPDNVADALGLLDAGGLEYMRIVSTNANPYFLIDPAGAGIKVGIGITGPGAKLDVYEPTTLGGTAGNNQIISRLRGNTTNVVIRSIWGLRDANGASWTTYRLHDGISVDGSFLTPGTNTKVWWERDPSGNIQSWGNAASAYLTINAGNVGIATTTIPHGGVGMAKFAIEGPDGSTAGPHVQITTAADDYPLLEMMMWAHDNVSFMFDAYYDGAYRSSDAGSNLRILKAADALYFRYDSGVAQGAVITWNDGFVLDLVTGQVKIPNLAGVGVRAVVAAADGTLSAP